MENGLLKIRLANDEDFDIIFSIWNEGIENSFDISQINPEKIKAKFISNFKNRFGIFNFWVAIDQDDIIQGWQSLIRASNNPFRENSFAESSTYVSQKSRYKGVGKMLLEFVMKEAEKSDLEYVVGFVTINNEAAKKITQQTGWIEVGEIPNSKAEKSILKKKFLIRPV